MGVEITTRRYTRLIEDIGRGILHNVHPNDIEIYLFAFELTDADNNTIDYMVLPINPVQISKTEPKRTNIKATASGITVLTSSAVIPQEIQIKGNFGRHFKYLVADFGTSSPGALAYSTKAGVYETYQDRQGFKVSSFDPSIKTGYGATRILKSMISKSNGRDARNRPFRLYFYNLAFGESYLVSIPPAGASYMQNQAQNMIWEYTINMSVIAPLDVLVNEGEIGASLRRALAVSTIQRSVQAVFSDLTTNILNELS